MHLLEFHGPDGLDGEKPPIPMCLCFDTAILIVQKGSKVCIVTLLGSGPYVEPCRGLCEFRLPPNGHKTDYTFPQEQKLASTPLYCQLMKQGSGLLEMLRWPWFWAWAETRSLARVWQPDSTALESLLSPSPIPQPTAIVI